MDASTLRWIDKETRRGVRVRSLDAQVPQALSLDLSAQRELLARWARGDAAKRTRTVLLKEAAGAGIERVDALCEQLLRAGWIERGERLQGGHWHWDWIAWRDLDGLRRLLGVTGKQHRAAQRESLLQEAQAWLAARSAGTQALADPDLLDEMEQAFAQLAQDSALRHDALAVRVRLVQALAEWSDSGAQGLRRDFALKARGTTKSIGAADWRWLEACFDLERLRISPFAPLLWLAGTVSLQWPAGRVDLAALHVAGLPLADVLRAQRVEQAPSGYWLIENRASFERQAQSLPPGQLLLWLPGRPSALWLEAVGQLLRLAPAPARISADADPAGVDIACTVGALWEAHRLPWEPHQMGLPQWESTAQRWALNDHDRSLLQRLLARPDLRPPLRALCEAMQREGRKAEQESWL